MKKYIMVIDEGTTGTRALLFDKEFRIAAQSYEEFTQYTPAEDKVEHDAMEILTKSVAMCKKAMETAQIKAEQIEAIGITNQRATCVVWVNTPENRTIMPLSGRTPERRQIVRQSMSRNGAIGPERQPDGR